MGKNRVLIENPTFYFFAPPLVCSHQPEEQEVVSDLQNRRLEG